MSNGLLYFFVGTTAELIKLVPVIAQARARNLPFRIIASGQNDIASSELWALAGVPGPDETLHTGSIHQSAAGLASWLARTAITGLAQLRRTFRRDGASRVAVIVHGDTVSTLLGATLAKALGAQVFHVEAGLRSFNYVQPFPEEICRVLVGRMANVAFCPNQWAADHLTSHRGLRTIVTGENTLLDSLKLALATRPPEETFDFLPENFFLLVLHRQENLFSKALVTHVIDAAERVAQGIRCVFVLHKLTEVALRRFGLLERVRQSDRFVLVPRLSYVTFTQTLARARFVITDGGSNQEESYYLGKPCLLLRKTTERIEGLNENVVLSPDPASAIASFAARHEEHARPVVSLEKSPSEIIVDTLEEWLRHG
ncbi:UDP-N-acetylglucosamine 2-epimerase [Pendulispora albinea]|uniref:UDP-N-acetylglucosamine 2-epimerase n=1 Tax=Pendulispora albinea TaxID=2741071 RepID=A0ABZ2LX80_9BACT